MNCKRTPSNEKANKSNKKHKKVISMDIKYDILRRFQAGEKMVKIATILGLAPTTVRTICNRDATHIKTTYEAATDAQLKSTVINRNELMVKMESLLAIWIERQNQKNMPLSKMVIQSKAKCIYDDLKEDHLTSTQSISEEFKASSGWFERFKARANLHNICLKGESASADVTAANEFKISLKAVIQEGGYCSKQVFNIDETGLFWKRLPKRTYISKMESTAPGFKTSKDRLTLLLGGNAYGDYKLKPLLIYKSDNPRALKNISKKSLPVYWASNKKAWVTSSLFVNWVNHYAIPEFKKYCKSENLPFKILVILDNAPGHPVYLDDLSDNIKFLFMPPNTTSLIQPMDQGVIANFKSYYIRRTFKQLLNASDRNEETTMVQFWKNYNIMDAITNIGDSWAEVKFSCMNGVWKKIWPECANCTEVDDVPDVRAEVINLAQESNFVGFDTADFNEILNVEEDIDINTADLIEMSQNIYNYSDESAEEPKLKKLTTKGIGKAIKLIHEAMEIFRDEDPDVDQSARVAREVENSINCYKKFYTDNKQKAVQMTLHDFIEKNTRLKH